MTRDEAIGFLTGYLTFSKITVSSMIGPAKEISEKTNEALSILLDEIKENDRKLEKYGIRGEK